MVDFDSLQAGGMCSAWPGRFRGIPSNSCPLLWCILIVCRDATALEHIGLWLASPGADLTLLLVTQISFS